jgi:hypothetical protein
LNSYIDTEIGFSSSRNRALWRSLDVRAMSICNIKNLDPNGCTLLVVLCIICVCISLEADAFSYVLTDYS